MFCNISGVILAGGANKRFNGITKANIVIGGKTIISRISDTLKDIFDEIMIVTNTPEKFKEYSHLKIIADTILKAGPIGGIHAALKSSESEALFVFAGDMPLLRKDIIIRQIDYFTTHNYDVVVPRIKNRIEPLHAIYDCSISKTLDEFLKEGNSYAVRDFFKLINIGFMQLDESIDTKNVFTNINTPSELDLIEKILGNSRL